LKIVKGKQECDLVLTGGQWILKKMSGIPSITEFPFALDARIVQDIIDTLADMRPANLVNRNRKATMKLINSKPFGSITITQSSRSGILRIGPSSPGNHDERLVILNLAQEKEQIFTAKKSEVDAIFVNNIFDLTLFNKTPDSAQRIELSRPGNKFSFLLEDGKWKSEAEGATVPNEKIKSLLKRLKPLVASHVFLKNETPPELGKPNGTLTVHYKDGSRCVIEIGKAQNNTSLLTMKIEGVDYLFEIPESTAKLLLME